MLKSVTSPLRSIIALIIDAPEGDVVKKIFKVPLIKPTRQKGPTENKTNRTDFSKNYMRKYREEGRDYQKSTDKVKEFRRKQRKKFKEHLKLKKPLTAMLIDQELNYRKDNAKPVTAEEFNFMCDRRGFDEEERLHLAEELSDLGLIS
jgi:hypothetical protein